MDQTITTKDGLLWRGGKIIELPEADHVACALGFACAEQLVKHLSNKEADGEKWYDEHLAPKLLDLAKDAHEHGLSFLAVLEWEPGETGRTAWMQEAHGLSIRMANVAAQTNGNVDAFWMWVQRYAKEHGHSSIFLDQQGIPQKPNTALSVTTHSKERRGA